MNYYKDSEGNIIYAYDDAQLSQAIRLRELESLIHQDEGAELTSSEYNLLKDEYDSVLPVVFDILENISSMSELTEDDVNIYTNPPVSNEILIESAERQRQVYLNEATEKIAPLQDAIDLSIATDIEKAVLISWKEYRVKLIRVDVSTVPDIDWPVKPE